MSETLSSPEKISHKYVLPFAPPMPVEFYGVVRFEFQAGKLVLAVVEERLKPEAQIGMRSTTAQSA